jgi:hypothetical protein
MITYIGMLGMTATKGTKKHINAEFQRCSRSRKVGPSVKGTYTSRHISSEGQTINTLISSDTSSGLQFPSLAPMNLEQPPTDSTSPEQEEDEGVPESSAKRTQVNVFPIPPYNTHPLSDKACFRWFHEDRGSIAECDSPAIRKPS